MSDDDAELVALIDSELDAGRRAGLLARLAADDGLRQRYEALRRTGAPLAAAFDVLLEQAPLTRLRTAFPPRTGFDGQGVSLELLSESWRPVLL